MKFRCLRFLVLFQSLLAFSLAKVVTENTVTSGFIDLSIGSITISPGVYWSIINNALSVLTGSLTVGEGSGFYITSNSNLIALNVGLAGILNSITNDGIISFNSAKSLTAPTYTLVGLSFENNGQMYLGGDGSIGIPVFSLTAANWNNNGLISFYQKTMSTGVVLLGGGGAVLPITNNGDICFFNTIFEQTTTIVGDGCLHVIGSSLMNLSQTLISVAQSQTIIFAPGSTGDILTSPLALSNTYTVRGFGDGMRIGNSLTIVRYSYSGSILTLTLDLLGLVTQKFDIGPGYDQSKFALVSKIYPNIGSPLRNALVYRGPVPSGAATDTKCGPCTSTVDEPQPTSSSLESSSTLSSAETSATSDLSISSSSTVSSSSQDTQSTGESSATSETLTSCPECTEYTTTWTSTGTDGKPTTGSGVVDVTTNSDGSLTTSTSTYPQPSATGCPECTEYTTTWTSTGTDGKPTTGSGVVDVTTNSDGSLTTSTSTYPQPSATGCPECTEYTTTWTSTGTDGKPTTGSGVVDVTTNSDGSLTTSTSTYPQPSATGCPECTEYTTTWTSTGTDGKPTTGSGVVDVTTDSEGSLTTSTSTYPQPYATGCPECTEYTTTWTSTGTDGKPTTGSGVVDVTTNSDGSLTTSTSTYPQPSATGCPECTEYTTTWTSTGTDGKPTTGSGVVDVTTNSDGSLTTSTSTYPQPSATGCPECTEYTTTWTSTGTDGKPTTGSGIVDVTTDSDGSLVTSTSSYPVQGETGCLECTEYTTTWTSTGTDGKPTTGSGVVDVTTDSDGSLVTSTSTYPQPSATGCPECTEYTTTWTSTGTDGKPTTGSGIVDVTTDSNGSLVTSTSSYPVQGETGCLECTEYTTTWTTTGADGKPTTGSGIVGVITDSNGSLVTSTSTYSVQGETGCPECTEYTTTWTTTGADGKPTTGSGIVDVTTDSNGSLVTQTSNYSEATVTVCLECTEYPTTWTTTFNNGKPSTASGIVDVTTNTDGSLTTTTDYHADATSAKCGVCEHKSTHITTVIDSTLTVTQQCDIMVTTDSAGSIYTTTQFEGQRSVTVQTSVVAPGVVYVSSAVIVENTQGGSLVTLTLPLGSTTVTKERELETPPATIDAVNTIPMAIAAETHVSANIEPFGSTPSNGSPSLNSHVGMPQIEPTLAAVALDSAGSRVLASASISKLLLVTVGLISVSFI
ncbi:hypothetical protein DICA2_C07514 [Diutina catenulata]